MSSVYIKGMEMPSCCGECRFLDEYGDYPCCIVTDEQRGYNFRIRELRMPHCPLIPVPDHGRLIDADAFRKEMDNHYPFDKFTQSKHGEADAAKGTIIMMLANASTIIPAYKEEDNENHCRQDSGKPH